MAITDEILERCRLCCAEAQKTLIALAEGRALDPSAVMIRRRASNIAADAAYALLRRAFITPLDREDVWQLHRCTEQLWRETENTALGVQNAQKRCLSSTLLHKTAACCEALHETFEKFPYSFDAAPIQHAVEDAMCVLLREQPDTLTEGLGRITSVCEYTLFLLQYTLLKNG